MFCRKCGKENDPGQAFCMNCGAPLNDIKMNGGYDRSARSNGGSSLSDILENGIDRKLLKKITALLLIVLAGIILFFTGRMWFGMYNAEVINEYQISTVDHDILETDSCVYYSGDVYLYRVYKDKDGIEKVINKNVNIIGGASDGIYFTDMSEDVYFVNDGKADPEKIEKMGKIKYISDMSDRYSFISGKYTYVIDGLCVTKQMNNKQQNSSIIYAPDEDTEYIEKAVKCENYLYMIISSQSHGTKCLMRLDLNTYKALKLIDSVDDFSMTNEKIACLMDDDSIVVMNVDGSNKSTFESNDDENYISEMLCMGDTVYYCDGWGRWYAFDMETQNEKNLYLESPIHEVTAGTDILARAYDDTIYIYDPDGTTLKEVPLS